MQWTNDGGDIMPEMVQAQISNPVLRLGSKGEVVKELQRLLTQWGIYSAAIDGIFERFTEESVREYQRRVFLPEDGIVGNKTWQALYKGAPVDMPELKKGSHGDFVMKLQRVLKSTQDYVGYVDGDFGPLTESALQSWQVRNNLPETGIVDESVWCALSKVKNR